jgi:hypothetical protein
MKLAPKDKQLNAAQMVGNAQIIPDVVNSNDVAIIGFQRYNDRFGRKGFKAHTSTRGVGGKKAKTSRHHVCTVVAKDKDYKGKISQADGVICDCDCERWLFKWEYAVWKKGAADLRRGNGEPPVSTNPRLYPSPCKHLYRLMLRIMSGRH